MSLDSNCNPVVTVSTTTSVQSKRTATEKENNAQNDKLSNIKNVAKNSKMRKLNPLLEKN